MTQKFELMQTNTAKLFLVWFGGYVVLLLVIIWGGKYLLTGASGNVHLALSLLVVLGGIYPVYRIGKSVSAVPTRVTVAPDQLTIYTPKHGEEIQVPFAHIASYRASSFNGEEALRLTLKDNRKLHLKINNRLYDDQDFNGMVAAFETAIGTFQRAAGPAARVRREGTFFEKPMSTLVLVLLTAGLAWAGWFMATNSLPVKASTFLVAGSYLTYVAAWYAARARRTHTEEAA